MDTEALIRLWTSSRDGDWTPEGLQAIRRLLEDRVGYIPEKKPNPLSPQPDTDTYHDHDKLLGLALRLSSLSPAFLVIAALSLLPVLATALSWAGGGFTGVTTQEWLRYFGASLVSAFQSGLVSIALFLVMKTVSEVIFLLMDIEHSTRSR